MWCNFDVAASNLIVEEGWLISFCPKIRRSLVQLSLHAPALQFFEWLCIKFEDNKFCGILLWLIEKCKWALLEKVNNIDLVPSSRNVRTPLRVTLFTWFDILRLLPLLQDKDLCGCHFDSDDNVITALDHKEVTSTKNWSESFKTTGLSV